MMSNQNETEPQGSLKYLVANELQKRGTGGSWVWTLFFLCFLPNILNGFHVSSYIFIGHVPNDSWCGMKEFKGTNWTNEQIRNISELNPHGCTIWDWNYFKLSKMSFEEALDYIKTQDKPPAISCESRPNSYFEYDEMDISIVPEWNLVCKKAVMKPIAQVMISVGKFFGASLYGIIADKYGRKKSFILSSGLYITGSLITTTSPWYPLFLIGRMGIGAAASGLFYSSFLILSENVSIKYRSSMSIAFQSSYPIGMLLLALAAFLIRPWRHLQLALTIPGFLLIPNCYFLPESPRWLLSKGKTAAAYEVVFKKKYDVVSDSRKVSDEEVNPSVLHRIKDFFHELRKLYGHSRMRRKAFTCYCIWCVTSFSYYVTALNADNIAANRYLYVTFTGCVDIPSYILPILLLKFTGRRVAAISLYTLSTVSLLCVLAVPEDQTEWLIVLAMVGHFGISGAYSIVTLHTAELFPTVIRSSALGTSSTIAHVGSMLSPYVVYLLGRLAWFIPTTMCGGATLAAGLLMLTLPETRFRHLKDHVDD